MMSSPDPAMASTDSNTLFATPRTSNVASTPESDKKPAAIYSMPNNDPCPKIDNGKENRCMEESSITASYAAAPSKEHAERIKNMFDPNRPEEKLKDPPPVAIGELACGTLQCSNATNPMSGIDTTTEYDLICLYGGNATNQAYASGDDMNQWQNNMVGYYKYNCMVGMQKTIAQLADNDKERIKNEKERIKNEAKRLEIDQKRLEIDQKNAETIAIYAHNHVNNNENGRRGPDDEKPEPTNINDGKDKSKPVEVLDPEHLLKKEFLRFVPPSAYGKTIVKALPPRGLPKTKKTNKFCDKCFNKWALKGESTFCGIPQHQNQMDKLMGSKPNQIA